MIKFGKQQIGKGIGRLTKGKFSEILGTLWSNSIKCENIKSGFISTGLFPIDKSKFPESYFDPIDLEHYLQNLKQTSNKNAELPPQESINNNNSEENNLNQSTSFSECPTNQLTSYTQNQKDIDSINTSNELITYNIDEQSTLCNLSTKNIVSIFSNQLNKLKEKTTENVPNNEPIPRLKVASYGEVLTTTEVLKRLEEAQSKKNYKKPTAKRGRPKKNINISQPEIATTNGNDKIHISEDEEDEEKCISSDSSYDVNDTPFDIDVEEVEYQQPQWSLVLPGTFILVDFIGGMYKKQHFKYVCVVESVDDEDLEIIAKGLKKENYVGDEFSINENDMTTIDLEMIIAILPVPQIIMKGRKMIYKFPGYVTVNEKE